MILLEILVKTTSCRFQQKIIIFVLIKVFGKQIKTIIVHRYE